MTEIRLNAPRGNMRMEIDLHMPQPWTVIFGPSGSGKSSILRALAGLWTPKGTTASIHGANMTSAPPHRRSAPLLAQHPRLFPHLNVMSNICFAPAHGDWRSAEDEAHRWMEVLHIFHLAKRKPHELSGGQQQRVAIARALVTAPRLLLLDETFSGTDTALRTGIVQILKQWQQQTGAEIISVTHDVAEAFQCADEVVKIADGKIIAQGSPDQVLAPERAGLLDTLAPKPHR